MYSTPLHLSPGYAAVLGHPVATPGAPPDPNSVSHARTGYHAPPTPSSELSSRLMRLEEKVSLLSPVPTTRASPSNLGIDRRGSDDEASASMRQSLVLEEQSLELEHRDLLLRRARESIVSLSEEVVQLKRGEGRVQSLIEQVSTLSKENENLQEQLQLKSSEAEAAKLTQEKVAAERTELASTRDQLAAEAAAGRGFKELYEQTKTSLTKLQIEEEGRRNAAMARAEALEGDLASTRHEISETTEKCRQLEKTLNEVRGERDRLNAALAQNKSGLIEIARELAVKTNLALAKGTELATAKESLEAHMHELKVWKESSSEMQSDLRALQEKLDAKEEDLSRSRQELSVREQELESVQDEAIRLQEELDKCIRVRDEAVKTEVELRRALIGSDGDIKSLRLEMTEQERRYEQADREIGHLEGLLDEQQGRFSELALDVETLQRERDEAMDLCKDYERSIMLALERIDDACVSHLGGRDELDASANRSPPSKQQGHPPSITGKMNATLDRILRRITGVSKLRRNFLRAAEATQENCLASLDEAHAHVEVLDGRASQAEASLRHLRAAIRQSADRQRSDTNDLKSQLQSANAQVRALTDRLATQQEDANGLRESHEQALAQLRSKLSEKAALLRDAHSAAASATASREVEQREERARRESLERECTALTHELDAVGGEHVSMVTERAVLKERCEGLSAQVAHLEVRLLYSFCPCQCTLLIYASKFLLYRVSSRGRQA
jgi:chromosome segregation ATPase